MLLMNVQTISLQYNVKNSEKKFSELSLGDGKESRDFVVVIQA